VAYDKVIAVIQARLGSKRLPGKVLREIHGKPMLWRIHRRLQEVRGLSDIVLAIPDNEENWPLRAFAWSAGFNFVTGSERDLIARIYDTAFIRGADAIVRITGDCPLVCPNLVFQMVHYWKRKPELEYLTNVQPRTFQKGLDVEIYSTDLLERLNQEIEDPYYRESFPEYVWKTDDIVWRNVHTLNKLPNLWWTVDYEEDLEFVDYVYRKIGKDVFPRWEVFMTLGREAYYERNLFTWEEGSFTATS